MRGLNIKAMGRAAAPEGPVLRGATPSKQEAVGAVSLRRLSVSLAEVQGIGNYEEEPGVHGDSFTKNWLARRPAIVMESDQNNLSRLEALESALAQAAQEGNHAAGEATATAGDGATRYHGDISPEPDRGPTGQGDAKNGSRREHGRRELGAGIPAALALEIDPLTVGAPG